MAEEAEEKRLAVANKMVSILAKLAQITRGRKIRRVRKVKKRKDLMKALPPVHHRLLRLLEKNFKYIPNPIASTKIVTFFH